MELKLHTSMTSIPRAIFTHSSSSIPFCTYAVLDASRCWNDNTSSRSTHKISPLCKEKHPNERKLKLDYQNKTTWMWTWWPCVKRVTLIKYWNSWVKVLLLIMAFILHSCICVSNRLIRMYCKCGSVKNARQVFDQMLDRNIASWHFDDWWVHE